MKAPTCPAHQDLPSYPREREDYVDPPAVLRGGPPVSPLRFVEGSIGWLVTGYHEARQVLSDPRFSAERWRGDDTVQPIPAWIRSNRGNGPGTFMVMDPPKHGRYRSLLTRYFTVKRARDLQARVEDIVVEGLDTLEAAGHPADLVRHFALPVPSLVICELLGVPYEERRTFQSVAASIMRQDLGEAAYDEARVTLVRFFDALIKSKRQRPGSDLISELTSGTELRNEEIMGIGAQLLVAGHETTMNMLSLGAFTLLRNPEQTRKLRADPSLIPGAVEELLRYLSILNAFPVRIALEDAVIGGATVRAGQSVAISVPTVNRDPALVDDPDTFDVGRPRSAHLAFGYGIHQCLGQHLARTELVAAFRGLLDRFPALELAVPVEKVRMRTDMVVYGVHELPVTW
ncbi:cytochrome P450 [Streptomyces phaeochromogenes]